MTKSLLGKLTRNLQTRQVLNAEGKRAKKHEDGSIFDLASATDDQSKFTKKTRVGLVRVRWAPRGVNVENFDKSDMAVYRRFLRWQRLRSIQHMLGHRGDETFKSVERVTKCFSVRTGPSVQVFYARVKKRAHYGGLYTCGSVWACPVCAAKITERRKVELEAANMNGLYAFMVTYTMQHDQKDKLIDLLKDLNNGLRDMKNSRGYKSLIVDACIVGSVTGLELMVGDVNGWHPHKHVMMFSSLPSNKINIKLVRDELSRLFVEAMTKRGRYVHDDIGVNVRGGEDVRREYLAKFGDDTKTNTWSLASEVTKSPVKTGRGDGHYHPFELVDMYQAGNMSAGSLFVEYVGAMKGKKQLVYTRGLRARLGLDKELSDSEIVMMQDQDADLFALLSAEDWRHILRHEKRAQLLEVASIGNYNQFVTWMRAIGRDDFGKG